MLQLDHVFCHISTIRFSLKFSELLVAGLEYITFFGDYILKTGSSGKTLLAKR